MQWFRIPKESSTKPNTGKYYSDWKEPLSIEGRGQCVYCTISLRSFGGIRNFHVEHYRPKGANKFPELENEYSNLFFACSICNGFKGDDWKSEPSTYLDNNAYPDPSKVNYSEFLFQTNLYLIDSKYITGRYIIQKLFLNRPQLILERKSFYLHEILKKEAEKLKDIVVEIKKQEKTNPFVDSLITASETIILLIGEKYINPYEQAQIQR
jgi:hypothetical protein